MNTPNYESIVQLAGSVEEDELPNNFMALPENIRQALAARMEKRKADRAEEAVDSIIALLDSSDNYIKRTVKSIRQYRCSINELKANLSKLEAARDYGMATQNFIPLMAALGYPINTEHRKLVEVDLTKIPANGKAEGDAPTD